MTKFFVYDKKEDIFFFHKGLQTNEKFKGNIDIGDIILDMSTKGRIVGIEILNASKFFKEVGIGISFLEKVNSKNIELKSKLTSQMMTVFIIFNVNKTRQSIPIAMPLKTHNN